MDAIVNEQSTRSGAGARATARAPSVRRSAPAAAAASSPWWDRFSFRLCLGLVVWAPLPLGSNRPWAIGLLAAATWLAIALRSLGAEPWKRGHRAWARLRPAAAPVALLAAFCALVALQRLGDPSGPIGTQDIFHTHVYLLRSLACLGGFVLVLLCAKSKERMRQLWMALVVAGLLQAVLAVVLHATRSTYQLFFTDFVQGQRAMGTFPNPDHLAGYLELTLSAGLGLLLAQFGADTQRRRAGWVGRLDAAADFLMSSKMRLRLMLIVMVVALVLSHSRMGNGAFFIALMLTGATVAAASRALRKPALWLVASMALVDVVIIGQWVGLDRVIERLQDTAESTAIDASGVSLEGPLAARQEESLQDRMRIPALSLQLLDGHLLFGRGGGTYVLALPAIKPEGFPHYWDHAHNDYVEFAVDTGLVGLGLLLAFAAATAWRALRLLDDRRPRLDRGIGVGTLMALLCMGLHGIVDFNLQIPSNAYTLAVLCAAVWGLPAPSAHAAGEADRMPG